MIGSQKCNYNNNFLTAKKGKFWEINLVTSGQKRTIKTQPYALQYKNDEILQLYKFVILCYL